MNDDEDLFDWEKHVEAVAADGGVKHQPNGLPIRCVRFDGHMFECEDADHPDYICPIKVFDPEFLSDFPESGDGLQTHAMIFCDNNVVITKYETCYGIYTRKNKWHAISDCFWKGTSLPEKTLELIKTRIKKNDIDSE